MQTTVVLDTNFIMVPFLYRIELFDGIREIVVGSYKIVIPSTALSELTSIARRKGKHALAAAGALKLLKEQIDAGTVSVIKTSMNVDKWILEYAVARKTVVCTNDRALRKNLKTLGVKIITVRGQRLFYL